MAGIFDLNFRSLLDSENLMIKNDHFFDRGSGVKSDRTYTVRPENRHNLLDCADFFGLYGSIFKGLTTRILRGSEQWKPLNRESLLDFRDIRAN